MQSYPDNSLESNYYDQQNPQQSQPSQPQQQPRIGALPPASSFFDNSPSSTEFHGNLDAGPSSSSGFTGMNNEYSSSNFNADPFFAGPSPGYMGHDPFAYHHDPQGYSRSMEMGYNHGPSHLNMNMMYDNQIPYGNDYGPASREQNPAMLTPLTGMPSVPPASQYVDPYSGNDMYQQPYPSQPTNLDSGANIYGQSDAGRSMYPPGPPPQQGQMYPMASEPINYPRIPDMAPPYMEMQPPMPQQMPRPPQTPQTVPSTPVTEKPIEQPPPTPVSAPIPASTPVESLKPVDTTIEDTVAEVVAQQTAPRPSLSTSPKTNKPKKRRYVRSFESIVDQMIPHPDPADGPTVKQHLQKQQLEKRMLEQAARKANKAKMEEEKRAAAVAEAVALGRPPPLMPPKRTRKKKAPAETKKESPEVINLDTSDVEILEQPSVPSAPPQPQQAEVQVQEVIIDEPVPAEVLHEEPPDSPKPKPKPKRARKPAAKRETAAQKRERLHYLHKAHHMQISMKSLVLKNTALADEVSRLFYRIQAATEERKRLAKQLQHYERNRMRRLQTQKRKQALAAATASPEHVFHEFQDYEGGEVYPYPPPAPSEPLFDVEEYQQEQEVVQQPEPSMSPADPNATGYPYEYFEPMPMQVVFRTFDVDEADLSSFRGQQSYKRPHEDQPLEVKAEVEEPAKPKRVRKPRAPKDPNAPPKKRQRRSKTAIAEDGAADVVKEEISVPGSMDATPSSESLPLTESVAVPAETIPEPDSTPSEAAPPSIIAPSSVPTPKPAPEPEHNPTEKVPI